MTARLPLAVERDGSVHYSRSDADDIGDLAGELLGWWDFYRTPHGSKIVARFDRTAFGGFQPARLDIGRLHTPNAVSHHVGDDGSPLSFERRVEAGMKVLARAHDAVVFLAEHDRRLGYASGTLRRPKP